jgi:hypothetical protein
MERALCRLPDSYYRWNGGGEFRLVTIDEYSKIKDITGITRARVNESDLRKCWNWQ